MKSPAEIADDAWTAIALGGGHPESQEFILSFIEEAIAAERAQADARVAAGLEEIAVSLHESAVAREKQGDPGGAAELRGHAAAIRARKP